MRESILPVLFYLGRSSPVSKPVVNMNGDYMISNPDLQSGQQWSGDYNKFHDVEFFEVYTTPISTQYGEVFWTMMDPIPLDADLVNQFKDKTMAVVGYETNQAICHILPLF